MAIDSLRIRSIECVPVRVALPRTYRGSHYQMANRCTLITRVVTEEGVVGEAYNGDTDEEQARVRSIVVDEIAELIRGKDALSTETCWETMEPVTYDVLRDRALAMQAVACVDSAIWDAVGRALEQPLYRLWGGYRDAVPMIGIGGYYGGEQGTIEEEVEFFLDKGMVGMKFKVGKASPEEDAQRLKRAVVAAAEGFAFIVDANQGYTREEAIRLVELASDFVRLRWFEEPCRWYNDRRNMRDVRLTTGVPVAAGQSEISRAGMRDLMIEGAIDVSNFDASWGGGPTEWRRVAALATAFDVQVGHHEEAQVSSHLLASIPHGTYVEAFHPDRDPIFWNMIENRPELKDGLFRLPDRPGLGWVLDRDFIERYRPDR